MNRAVLWFVGFLVLAASSPGWTQSSGESPYVEAVTQLLTEKLGRAPEVEEVVETLNRITIGLHGDGRYALAEEVARAAYRLGQDALPEDHADTLTALNNLAGMVQSQGRYGEAEPLYLRALQASERVLGADHPDTLISVNNLAALYESQGRTGEAEPLLLRALQARERLLGADHPDTLRSVNNLAGLYESQGRYGEAEPLYLRALQARERVLGADHPDTLGSVNNLAFLYQSQGRAGEAEPLYLRALQASERVLGADHPQTLSSVNNLAFLYQAQGRTGEAEPLYLRALQARERVLGADHPQTLGSVNNLAGLYRAQGRTGEAEPLYLRALQASERVLGADHPQTLSSVNNLADLYRAQGRTGEAEPLYLRALQASERVLGADHPQTLSSVNNLAFLHRARGDYAEAEALLRQVVRGRAKALDPTHPDLSAARISLAATLLNQERPRARREALAELKRVDRDLRAHVQRQLGDTLGERVRRQLLVSASVLQDLALTLALERPEAPTRAFAANLILRWKRLAGEEEAFVARLIRRTRDPDIIALGEALTEARAGLTHLINLPEAAFDREAAAAQRQAVEQLEVKLADRSRAFRQAQQGANWEAIQAQLPLDSALLELRLYRPFDLKTGDRGELRWAALLLPANATHAEEIQIWDLGPVDGTESPTTWLGEAAVARGDRGRAGRTKSDGFERLLRPLAEQLAAFQSVYLSPDGPLELFPFHQLTLEPDHYWAQRQIDGEPQMLHMVRTGRDLLPDPLASENGSRPGFLAFGDVEYERYAKGFPSFLKRGAQKPRATPSPSLPHSGVLSASLETPNDRLSARGEFTRLTYTGAEVEEIRDGFLDQDGPDPVIVTGAAASEAALKALEQPPRILHLATHGFFFAEKGERTERPLTLSGVALAGANRGMEGQLSPEGEDGILYALEAQGLNLEGTELVTLSACDTGQGEVDYSEGVYGLVRAFQIAGAKNVLISLRKVDDLMAKEFMVDFYRNWFEDPDQHPAIPLHQTRLDWIESPDPARRDPANWAPWVLWERR